MTGKIEDFKLYQMGQEKEKKENITALLKSNFLSPEQIAQALDVPFDYVKQLQRELSV